MIFAVNAARTRARITSDAAVALSQHGTVAPVTVHQRVDFATSMIDGRTVMEMNPKSRSAGEIAGLWGYISTRVGKLEHRQTQVPFEGGDRRYPNTGRSFGQRGATRSFGQRGSN